MRYPNHIILDISKSHNSTITSNWTNSYKSFISKTNHYNNTLCVVDNIKLSRKTIIRNSESTVQIKTTTTSFSTPLINPLINAKTNSLLWSLFDINFLKKEKMYTKLKYSRSPQYDIVSGGVAALFAGFLGFLISEKFGIELVDSGDFYTFFMYIVFLCFSTRPFFRIMSKKNTVYHFFSLKYIIEYMYTVSFLVLNAMISFTNFKIVRSFMSTTTVFNFFKNNEYFSFMGTQFTKIIQFLKNFPSNK